jgi:hypothetical protein
MAGNLFASRSHWTIGDRLEHHSEYLFLVWEKDIQQSVGKRFDHNMQ